MMVIAAVWTVNPHAAFLARKEWKAGGG